MVEIIELETTRLKLRQWQNDDYPVFAALNAAPVVMEYFPNPLNETESNIMANRIRSDISERGWGFWAVEEKSSGNFTGFVGLHTPLPELPFSPCVEIGWRLDRAYWGKGYATEAARAALKLAFEHLEVPEVYSFTPTGNFRSRAVMGRLGMVNTTQDFEYPSIPEGHQLRKHVLYKITKEQWVHHESH